MRAGVWATYQAWVARILGVVLGFQDVAWAAPNLESVVYSHSSPHRFKVDHAPNGVPLVQLSPSCPQHKVSRSLYTCFDVGEEGLILNNGASPACGKLGGFVTGNPGMGGAAPARVIVNEVENGLPTRLRGAIEVYGPKAELIIANPAGIILEQASFLNVSKVTLVSGKGCWSPEGQLMGFDVGEKGRLCAKFEGSVLDGLAQMDLVSRVIKLSGEAHLGKESLFQATAGLGRYDVQSQAFEPLEAAASLPQQTLSKKVRYGVNGASTSGIYAGQIRLKALEPGVGIRTPGRLVAKEKDIELLASGDSVLQHLSAAKVLARVVEGRLDLAPGGKLFATGALHVSAGTDLTLGVGSELLSGGEARLTAAKKLVASGLIQSEAGLHVKAQGLDQTEEATFQAKEDIQLEVSKRADLKGKIYGKGKIVAEAEDLAQYPTGELLGEGSVALRAGCLQAFGQVESRLGAVKIEARKLIQGPKGTLQGMCGVGIHVADVAQMGGQTNSQAGSVTLNAKTLEQGQGGIHGHTGVQLTLTDQATSKGEISSSAGSIQIVADEFKSESAIKGHLGVEVRVKQDLKAPTLISEAGRVTIRAKSFSQNKDSFIKGHGGVAVRVAGKINKQPRW
jgi:filamentous hemagglutinin